MGCGKSTLGKQLALNMHKPFIDIDIEIEQAEGKSIADIFQWDGEKRFRTAEHCILIDIINKYTDAVIATGGGTPCFNDNMELMYFHGLTVYLKLSPQHLLQRIINSNKIRPLMNTKEKEKKLNWVTQLLALREPYYNKAHITVDALNLKAETLLHYISYFNDFNTNNSYQDHL